MANTYKMVNLDRLQATKAGGIVSVKWDGGRLENGTPITLGNLVTGETEVFYAQCTGATGTLASSAVYLVANPEVMYEAGTMIDDFVATTGQIMRAYPLANSDIFTLSSGAYIGGTAALTDYVIMTATGAANGLSTWILTGTMSANRTVGKVIELTTIGYDDNNAASVLIIKA
jgi:hypothetical protein